MIDNSAGLIPVPMTEIEISRTIFRSGDSEYRIGGQVVRLLDVQELLSESGIGRAAPHRRRPGQLEEVLTARPEDRRTYIEEAAGSRSTASARSAPNASSPGSIRTCSGSRTCSPSSVAS